jgi:Transposase DDE domain
VARGAPQRGVGGGPVRHAGLNQRERLAGPSVPSFTTPNPWFDLTPRFSQRAEQRWRARRSCRTLKTTNRAAVLWIETDSIPLIGPRKRLPLSFIVRLVRKIGEMLEVKASSEWLWKGHPVHMVDGSTASMPDTPANQKAYPQPVSQKPGVGFPLARFVTIISLATGAVLDLAIGPCFGKRSGETSLLRALLRRIKAGAILLGDRSFASYFGIAELLNRKIDGVFRMHQRRKIDFRRGRCLGITDHIVIWQKPKRPEWMDEATYEQMPQEVRVRELRFRVQQAGYRVHEIVLVTTLLDPVVYTKDDLADLFLKRWNIELDLRSIKIVLQMDVLRCKTPDLVDNGADQRNGVSFDPQDGSAVGGFQGAT